MPRRNSFNYWSPNNSDSAGSSVHDPYPPINDKERYIDPWDLENYAYIREHLDSLELSSVSDVNGEIAEANSSSFLYVPGSEVISYDHKVRKSTNGGRHYVTDNANYVAIDEVTPMYDDGPKMDYVQGPRRRGPVMDPYEGSHEGSQGDEDSSVFGIYDTTGQFRKVALPISTETLKKERDRSISFSYGDYDYRQDIYSKLEDLAGKSECTLPLYDDLRRYRKKPENFGLSNYGHLKIDYSYSWNNLNKFIKCNN